MVPKVRFGGCLVGVRFEVPLVSFEIDCVVGSMAWLGLALA
jgi:hypothetical protein